jgi:hypothetical protein
MAEVNSSAYEAADGSAAGPAYSQVYEQVQALLAAGRQDEAVELLLAALSAVLRQSRQLELLLLQLRRAQRSTRSEKISPEQLALLLEELHQLGWPGRSRTRRRKRRKTSCSRRRSSGRKRPRRSVGKGGAHGVRAGTHVPVSSVRSTM